LKDISSHPSLRLVRGGGEISYDPPTNKTVIVIDDLRLHRLRRMRKMKAMWRFMTTFGLNREIKMDGWSAVRTTVIRDNFGIKLGACDNTKIWLNPEF
jgi:hypothetical protein